MLRVWILLLNQLYEYKIITRYANMVASTSKTFIDFNLKLHYLYHHGWLTKFLFFPKKNRINFTYAISYFHDISLYFKCDFPPLLVKW